MQRVILKVYSAILFFCLSLFFCASCENTLSSPQTTLSSNSNTTFSAPQDLTATNGTKRKITLTWTEVAKAKRYDIYAADTPFDDFIQVGETTKTSFSYENLGAGVKKYLKVQAVDYSGDVSGFSSIVLGSTLAKPIVTYIEEDSDSSSATIYWWAKNCDSSTYLDNVRFEVRCLKANKSDVFAEDVVYGGTESYTFKELLPATKYYYQVSAYVVSDMSTTEDSDLVDLTTAHCLLPDAPVNFEASKGSFASEISLTWQLPNLVEVSNDSLYENHPVYFKIFRKLKDSTGGYETLCDYVGTVSSNPDCVTIEAYTGSDVTVSSDYPSYIPLSKVTYVDSTDLSSGKQYEYKVQSYVDDSTDAITSNTLSVATDYGWLCPVPALQVSSEYNESEDNSAYSSIDVNFEATIQEFNGGSDYIYVLEETKSDFDSDEETSACLKSANSLAAINNFTRTFENPDEEKGYYSYKLYVLDSKDSENAASDYGALAILSSASTSKITVTDDKNAIPKIEDFNITEGYSDKFVISWKYDSSCSYSLGWTEYNSGGTEKETGTYELTSEDVANAADGTAFAFEHAADSGSKRLYTLTADKGLKKTETYSSLTETLGTAEPVFAGPDYATITVTWDSVQKATDYKITAYYEDDEGTTSNYLVNEGEVCSQNWNTTECEITQDDSGKVTCVITNPNRYSDSVWSGKPIKFMVKATNDLDSTTALTSVRTLGPALIGTTIGSKQANYISVSWNEIEGAEGYLIHRTRYTDGSGSATTDSSFDTYYFDGTKLQINSENVDSNCAEVSLSDSVYTLKDSYYESDDAGGYEKNQAKISWGTPYGYVVLPVLSSEDFEFETATTLSSSSKIQYSNLSDSKGAAYGYGLNVRAHKAESGTTQTLEWEPPYYGSSLTPNIYYREAGSTENSWTKISTNPSSKTVTFTPVSATKTYEYAVAYSKTSTTISLPLSFVEDSETCGLSVMETDGANYDYTGKNLEKLNKGYLLAVDFKAGYGGTLQDDGSYATDDEKYYSEKVDWEAWDYDERSIGPSSAYISIKNYNLSSDWTKVALLDGDLHYSESEVLENTTVSQSGDVSVYLAPNTVSTADSVTNGTMLNTAGPLMVLRDAKHYYSLTLERDEVSVTLGSDDSVYGYRQLSDAEIARAAMLALSYGFYLHDGGLANYSNVSSQFKYTDAGTVNGESGTMTFTKGEYYGIFTSYSGKYHASYSLSGNFAPSQLTPGGVSATCVGLTSSSSSFDGGFRIKGSSDYYLYQFASTDSIEVATGDSSIPLDYSATISFICNSQDDLSLKITRNGTTTTLCDTSDNTVRKYWCPMQIHDNQSYVITQSYYGWWVE